MNQGRLELRLQSASISDRVESGAVARILPLGSEQLASRDVVVPAGPGAGIFIDLEPGLYAIQLILPSGRVLQAKRQVRANVTSRVVFSTTAPPQAWLAWQQFEGVALSENARPARARESAIPARPSTTDAAPPISNRMRLKALDDQVRTAAPSAGKSVSGPVARLGFVSDPRLDGSSAWTFLGEGDVSGLANVRSAGGPDERQRGTHLWRVGNLQSESDGGWARIEVPAGLELVRLPLPWPTFSSVPSGVVELTIDGDAGHQRAATSILVRDPQLGGLLAYLARGRLGAARAIVDNLDNLGVITATIDAKLNNPLAACAAAYVGLAIFEPAEQERWDAWLPNLMNWFPLIPDGAILHARRILLRPRDEREAASVPGLLARAYATGVPYFSAGVELLRDMLRQTATQNLTGNVMLDSVSRLASRLESTEAFTVLRYPKV